MSPCSFRAMVSPMVNSGDMSIPDHQVCTSMPDSVIHWTRSRNGEVPAQERTLAGHHLDLGVNVNPWNTDHLTPHTEHSSFNTDPGSTRMGACSCSWKGKVFVDGNQRCHQAENSIISPRLPPHSVSASPSSREFSLGPGGTTEWGAGVKCRAATWWVVSTVAEDGTFL